MNKPGSIWLQLKSEVRELLTFNKSDRRWPMPLAAALAAGFPLLAASTWGQMTYGLIGSLGGLIFLYMPNTPMHHRMIMLMACSFGMLACYTLGAITHFYPPLVVIALTTIAVLVTMVCRFYGLGPPGSLFFIMAAAIAAYSPAKLADLPIHVGLLALGCLLACTIGFVYSLFSMRQQSSLEIPAIPAPTFDFVVLDSVIIGAFVGLSLGIAQLLQLDRPYWVPISCLAVIQGASMRAVWIRQAHRLAGTAMGLLLAWIVFQIPLNTLSMALIMTLLVFVIEYLVVRHYGLAVIFITPLTILLAEAAQIDHASASAMMNARFIDTMLGCFIGLCGGLCLHNATFRKWAGGAIRKLISKDVIAS